MLLLILKLVLSVLGEDLAQGIGRKGLISVKSLAVKREEKTLDIGISQDEYVVMYFNRPFFWSWSGFKVSIVVQSNDKDLFLSY